MKPTVAPAGSFLAILRAMISLSSAILACAVFGGSLFSSASAAPVISEIHYHPADDATLGSLPLEFIELHNPGTVAVDLSGWSLVDAVTYTFPAGTVLNPESYRVVAQDPAVLQTKYGIQSLGPWTGKLSNSGETIELRNASGETIDIVAYRPGFPWPTAVDGGGPSMELIHPLLDNDLGSSWRSSGTDGTPAVTYVSPSSTGWKYLKGLAEASAPVDAWRENAFIDSSWADGTAPIGYGSTVPCNTVLTDMQGQYSTVYARKTFTIAAGQIPDDLVLSVRVDDGCVVWINGTEVYRNFMPEGEVAYNAFATNWHDTAGWITINLSSASAYLIGGTNVLAIHGANITLGGSSDFSIDAELSAPAIGVSSNPTPGAPNAASLAAADVPPQIRQVAHSPVQPVANSPVTITAKITDTDGMGAVSLSYQTVDPGSYIRLTDAVYQTSWTTVPMADNGTGGDLVAGDSFYTAVLPAGLQAHRRLVRYRILFADSLGNSQTVPYPDDEQPNFAYYVYTELPDWQGAFRPGSTPIQTFPAATLDDVPVYSLIANGTDVINSQYNSGYDAVRFHGTFVYDGEVYDHIEFKNRGEHSTYVSGKNKWRFFFNRARDLPARNNLGKKYSETWGSFSGDACTSPWAAVHRGMAGVEEAASYKIYQIAGLPSPNTHYYHFRVVRGAAETPAAGTTVADPIGTADGQYAGDFWGLYLAVEQPDGSFLDERDLPDGNVYKIEGNAGDKKHQAADQPLDSSDWNTFRDAHVSPNPTEAWWRANMDMDAYYTFHALNRIVGNVDLRYGNNHYFYHRSTDGRWVPIPWDLDMMFIAKTHWSGIIDAHKSITQNPALALEFRNRAREILDLMASDATASGGQFGQLVDEFATIVNPAGPLLTWADADAAMWNLHPRTMGTDGNASGQTNHKGNFFRTSFLDNRFGGNWTRWLGSPSSSGTMTHEDSMVYLRDYATDAWSGDTWSINNGNQLGYGYQYLASEASGADIPATPVLSAMGDPAFPVSDLTFSSSAFSDPQGSGSFAAWQWRIAEISAPGISGHNPTKPRKYEIEALVQSPELTTGPGAFTIPLGIAEPGKTYRVRVRHKDLTGNWSHWSAPVQFGATTPPLELVHYWNFNDTANLLAPTQSTGGAQLQVSGTYLFDDNEDFAAINARSENVAGTHLRVNNPLGATLDLSIPTSGYENIIVQYETRRSGQGAGLQHVSYTLDGVTFIDYANFEILDDDPELKILDFRSIPGANDNPAFALRIVFTQGAGGTAGNNRFDNLTVEGDALQDGGFNSWKLASFSDPADLSNEQISGPTANPSGDGVANLIRYSLGVGPYEPVIHLMPTLSQQNDSRVLQFRYDPSKTDLVWRVRASNDLGTWTHVLFDSSTSEIPPLEDGWLSLTLPEFLGTGPQPDPTMFTRMEVELVAP